MDNKLSLTFWSGVGSVTGANFLLECNKTRILVDCGLMQGTPEADTENRKKFPYDPKTIDFLFATHSHMDHIGRICKLVKDGFSGVIYSTPETKELALVMLQDAIKVMEMNRREQNLAPLYGPEDLDKAMSLWQTISYHDTKKVSDSVSVLVKDAGHILGSAMYEFSCAGNSKKETKILFTGDSGNSPSPLLKDTESIAGVDYLVMDSVYGDRNHEPKDVRDERFKTIVEETIHAGGTLVIPAFSLERTQVVLYELNNLIEDKKIPSVPVYLDSPLGEKVTEIYKHSTENFNEAVQSEIKGGDDIFNFPKLFITHGFKDSEDIEYHLNSKIIIAGSGMSSGGRVVGHETKFLPDPKATVLLMGYQAPGTLGRQIENKPSQVEINDAMIPIRARIEMITGFSSHKDSDHLVQMVEETAETVKKVFVVMGEPKSSTFLVQRLQNELSVSAEYPKRGILYTL
ncbi:MAG: MBL fold metallo-hydrolase [bacterium]